MMPGSTKPLLPGVPLCLLLSILVLAGPPGRAENVDPDMDGSKYAWSENTGWLNAQPSGPGGPGMHVGEFELTGWMWSENTGWISLSCSNTTSCGTVDYGVRNEAGLLTGFAWAENAGWVSFSCQNTASCGTASYGVTIDPATGLFDGRAWAENVGWITFASNGPDPYGVKTGWTCSLPVGSPDLSLTKVGIDTLLSWSAIAGASAYDVQLGSLGLLRGSGGDYSLATTECMESNLFATSAGHTGDPPPGEAYWFLVRGADCGGASYDTAGTGQAAPRDAGVSASAATCN